MSIHFLKLLIEKIKLQLLILKIQLQIKLLKQKRTIPNLPKPEFIMLHHGGGYWSFQQVNNHHKNLWGFKSSLNYYIGYHYFIEDDGTIYHARADNEEGAHCVDPTKPPRYYNRKAIGICLQGNLIMRQPTREQLRSLEQIVEKLKLKYNIPKNKIGGHQEFWPKTDCPGSLMKFIKDYKGRLIN